MWRLTPLTTRRPRYDFAISSVARVCIVTSLFASLNLSLGYGLGGFSATYEHPTIVSKESQRIALNLAPFGIKNARGLRWRPCKNEFFLPRGIYKLLPNGLAIRLLNLNISLCHNMIQLTSTLRGALPGALLEDGLNSVGGHS